MAKTALRSIDVPPPPRSPEREALAAAIARFEAAKQDVDDNSKAMRIAYDRILELRRVIDDVEMAIEDETASDASEIRARLLSGGGGLVPSSLTAGARQRLRDAQQELEQMRDMHAQLEAEKKPLDSALYFARSHLDDCVSAVVRASGIGEKILADYEAARREVARLSEILRFIAFPSGLGTSWDTLRDYQSTGAALPYQTAIEALATDADAPLPSATP